MNLLFFRLSNALTFNLLQDFFLEFIMKNQMTFHTQAIIQTYVQKSCINAEKKGLPFNISLYFCTVRTKAGYHQPPPSPPVLPPPVLLLQFLLCLNFSHCASLHLSNSSQTDASPELQSCGVEVMKATSRVPLQDPSSSSASTNSLI